MLYPQGLETRKTERWRFVELSPSDHGVDRGRHDQREHQREEQAADDADGEGLEELGAGAEGDRKSVV